MSRVCFSCLKSAPPSYITDLKNAYMDGMQEIIVDDTPVTLLWEKMSRDPLQERVASPKVPIAQILSQMSYIILYLVTISFA